MPKQYGNEYNERVVFLRENFGYFLRFRAARNLSLGNYSNLFNSRGMKGLLSKLTKTKNESLDENVIYLDSRISSDPIENSDLTQSEYKESKV